jgi:hypothetical protein
MARTVRRVECPGNSPASDFGPRKRDQDVEAEEKRAGPSLLRPDVAAQSLCRTARRVYVARRKTSRDNTGEAVIGNYQRSQIMSLRGPGLRPREAAFRQSRDPFLTHGCVIYKPAIEALSPTSLPVVRAFPAGHDPSLVSTARTEPKIPHSTLRPW